MLRRQRHRDETWRELPARAFMEVSTESFEAFLADASPRLWRAFVAARGVDGAEDAVSEALAWAWEHRARLVTMANPVGYLYRVGLTRSIPRKQPIDLPSPADVHLPEVEPELIPALLGLTERQRSAVWLVHACGWSYSEVASALGISESTVGTHVTRALEALRNHLEAPRHV